MPENDYFELKDYVKKKKERGLLREDVSKLEKTSPKGDSQDVKKASKTHSKDEHAKVAGGLTPLSLKERAKSYAQEAEWDVGEELYLQNSNGDLSRDKRLAKELNKNIKKHEKIKEELDGVESNNPVRREEFIAEGDLKKQYKLEQNLTEARNDMTSPKEPPLGTPLALD
jgi:hypothetical protein